MKETKEEILKILSEFKEPKINQFQASMNKMVNFIESTHSNEILINVIKEKIRLENWEDICIFIFVIQRILDKIFIPLLCEILNNHRHFNLLEGIADALYDIADESCIDPIMCFLLEYEIEEDLGYHLRNKFLDVLDKIKTEKAILAIKRVSLSSNSQLNYLALRWLKNYPNYN